MGGIVSVNTFFVSLVNWRLACKTPDVYVEIQSVEKNTKLKLSQNFVDENLCCACRIHLFLQIIILQRVKLTLFGLKVAL